MKGNPYESPATIEERAASAPGSIYVVGIGFVGGTLVGGTAGAMQGAALMVMTIATAVLFDQAVVAMNTAVVAVCAATIVGALVGALVGCVIGPILGGIAAIFGLQSRRFLKVTGLTAATFSTVISSVMGIQAIVSSGPSRLQHAAAIVSGIASGLFGGMIFLQRFVRLAWPEKA
jgi:hypothetical protein